MPTSNGPVHPADAPTLSPTKNAPATAATSESSAAHTSNTNQPSTPLRGRSLYPTARVPLHRRGTSSTYERLEDLLREAGYTETRVFTPESERHNVATSRNSNSVRGGVGAVVGFLAGLVSRNSSLARGAKLQEDPVSSPVPSEHMSSQPPSPLARISHIRPLQASSSTSLNTSAYSFGASQESLHRHTRPHANGQTRPRPRKELSEENGKASPTQNHTPYPSRSSRAHPHQPHAHLHHDIRNQLSFNSSSTNAPKAHAYLRHMASAPNIQPLAKRPSSNVSLRSHRPPYPRFRSSHRTVPLSSNIAETDDVPHPPPLPRNWMESVAKALLLGVASDGSSMRTARQTSSALSETTNMPRDLRRPPLLCAQVREQRARTSEVAVSRASVVCRSAPASRAGSRVRRGTEEDSGPRNRRDEERRKRGKRDDEARKKGKGRVSDMVPSLARTKVVDDDWGMREYLNSTVHDDVRQEASSDDDLDDEDEEEGEIDLERLLVPARRQASIRSLRKHLHPMGATGSLRNARAASPSSSGRLSPFVSIARPRDWPIDSWSSSRGRRWVVGEDDDDEGDGYGNGAFSGSEMGTDTRAGTKRRRGLPGAWAQWGS